MVAEDLPCARLPPALPKRRETGLATLTVFIMATIAAIFFLLVDMVLSNAVQLVLGLGA